MAESKQEQWARRRSLKKLSSLKDSAREDARRAVEFAAKVAFRSAAHHNNANANANGSPQSKLDNTNRSTGGGRRNSFDLSNDSHSSFLSHERATRRGSKRGIFEMNELPSDNESSMDRELTTVTDKTRVTSLSGNHRKNDNESRWPLLKNKQKKGKNEKRYLTAEISKEAWMCGVCAKSFSSFEAAELHEEYHIKEVVTDLGWTITNNSGSFSQMHSSSGSTNININMNFPITPAVTSSAIEPRTPDRKPSCGATMSVPNISAPRPQPDALRMSTPVLSSRVSFQPYNTPALQRKKRISVRRFSDDMQSDEDLLHEEYGLTTSVIQYNMPSAMSPIIENRDSMNDHDLLVPHGMREYVVLADEALVDVCAKGLPMILTATERECEMELEWLAKDKSHYDLLSHRALERQRGGAYSRFRTEGQTMMNKVQNKFVDAYQLMKEGQSKRGKTSMDHYNRKLKGDNETEHVIEHSKNTLYVNVIVKNSIKVVRHELERLAKQRWEETRGKVETDVQAQRFQKFRAAAQDNLVKLAGMALASDFTPRRIAIQMSNDLYRLLTPRLKRRGVTIETEIEYRVGPFFVLAFNVKRVDWKRLVKYANRDAAERKARWRKEKEDAEKDEPKKREAGVVVSFVLLCYRLTRLTQLEVMAQVLAWFHSFHCVIYTPICFVLYHIFLGDLFRRYFFSSVANEIFFYVEEKGMEMDIGIRDASTQAAFMLSALREIRADGRELKKKQQEGDGAKKSVILGPLLGPAIKTDKGSAPPMPDGFEMPDNLEFVGLELDLAVGFKRLRWAFLYSKSQFIPEAVFKTEARYENIQLGTWTKHDDAIGLAMLPDGVKEEDVIGAEKQMSYLMPKSAFVKANICSETASIEAYNDYCFCMKKKALTPDVPYGSTFIAWTKFVVINTGSDSCKLICSVEAEFPNGPPLVSRQIKSGMRAGVGELFIKIGETITKYADEYP